MDPHVNSGWQSKTKWSWQSAAAQGLRRPCALPGVVVYSAIAFLAIAGLTKTDGHPLIKLIHAE